MKHGSNSKIWTFSNNLEKWRGKTPWNFQSPPAKMNCSTKETPALKNSSVLLHVEKLLYIYSKGNANCKTARSGCFSSSLEIVILFSHFQEVCLTHGLQSNCQFILYITGCCNFSLTSHELSSLPCNSKHLSANHLNNVCRNLTVNCLLCLCCLEFYELHPSKKISISLHYHPPANPGVAETIKLYLWAVILPVHTHNIEGALKSKAALFDT